LDAGAAHGLEQAERSTCDNVCGKLGNFEADLYMALRSQVVDFVRTNFVKESGERATIRQIGVMKKESGVGFMKILVNVVEALRVETRGTALEAVNLITFGKKKLR
jgi:hypothetical protein